MSEIIALSYSELMALRRALNARLYFRDAGDDYVLVVQDGTLILMTHVRKGTADATDFETTIQSHGNKPITSEERRFLTHNFADISTWDGRTTGDPASWVTGAITYDDVIYRWNDAQGNRVAYLDTSVSPAVWKNDAGTQIVHYDSTQDKWIRDDTSADVTSSRFSVVPYAGKKLEVRQITILAEVGAMLATPVHFKLYTDYPPYGVVLARDSVYKSVAEFRSAVNLVPTADPVNSPWTSSNALNMVFDYATTAPFTLDSRQSQRIDVEIEQHQKITGCNRAVGGFVCINWDSF